MIKHNKTYIIALTKYMALYYARQRGLDLSRVVFVESLEKLRGIRGATLIKGPRWSMRIINHKILAMAKQRDFIIEEENEDE